MSASAFPDSLGRHSEQEDPIPPRPDGSTPEDVQRFEVSTIESVTDLSLAHSLFDDMLRDYLSENRHSEESEEPNLEPSRKKSRKHELSLLTVFNPASAIEKWTGHAAVHSHNLDKVIAMGHHAFSQNAFCPFEFRPQFGCHAYCPPELLNHWPCGADFYALLLILDSMIADGEKTS
jgi:hypothetical protein